MGTGMLPGYHEGRIQSPGEPPPGDLLYERFGLFYHPAAGSKHLYPAD